MSKILVIDDEAQIRHFLRIGLSAKGYEVIEAAIGEEGLQKTALEAPDLVVLDLGLPDMDGLEVLKAMREFYKGPLIILSVRNREQEKVAALDGGANDYVVKPFGINELLARMRVLLRASGQPGSVFSEYNDAALHVDVLQRIVVVDGQMVRLSRKEFDLLKLLLEFQDRVITQQQILDRLWGKTHVQDTHYLRILVGKLRAKLGDDASAPRFIETEPGVGYRFLPSSTH